MDQSPPPVPAGPLARLPRPAQWLALIAASVLISAVFVAIDLPAALLIGPMIAAAAAGTSGAAIRVPKLPFAAAQAVIGCLVAASIEIEIVASVLENWPLMAFAVLSTVAASSFLGWGISRLRILPGSTGVWGSAPGGATAMVLMAGAFGADARLVAFMQYLRVIMVTMTAAFVAHFWVDTSGVQTSHVWFPPIDPTALLSTLAVGLVGGVLFSILRLPSPYLLGAMIVGIAAHLLAGVNYQLPPWLLAASYALVGWTVGLNFDRAVLAHAAKALPKIALSIALLMAFCGGIAWVLADQLGVDPLTAYLATSPGGMDSVAIIAAASSSVNISFVMALQSCRFLFVLLCGPALARLVARTVRE